MKAIKSNAIAEKKLVPGISKKSKAEEKCSKKKTSKANKDSGAPKRPPTAFFVFMDDFRKSYKENFPDNKSVAAVTKAGGQKWKELSEAEKAPYAAKAASKKAEYEIAKAEFATNNGKIKTEKTEDSGIQDDAEGEASS